MTNVRFLISRCFAGLTTMAIFLLLISCSTDENDPQISKDENLVINEIYTSSGEDWIELYNDTDAEKDLSGYKVYDDVTNKYTLPPNTTIAGKGWLVIICDDTGSGLSANFKLSSLGETVFLENASGNVLDKVSFPVLEDGQSFGRFPDGSDDLRISGNSTRGGTNGSTTAPFINSVSRAPLVPATNDEVTITVEVLNTMSVSSVILYYQVNNGSFTSAGMQQTGTQYTAVIPPLMTTGLVNYYVEVENKDQVKSYSPFNAPVNTHSYLINTDPLPNLKINEFLAVNSSCCPDTDGGTQEFDDWIEIYNAGTSSVNIANFYFSDDLSNPFNSRIKDSDPSKTTIAPGGFLVIWADNNRSQGELHLDFQLSADGEEIGLFYKDGRPIDTHSFGTQTENRSAGLTVDGGTTWTSFATPTPGSTNQ